MVKDKDDSISREEFIANLSCQRGMPMLMAVWPGGRGDVMDTHVAWHLSRSIAEIRTQTRLCAFRTGR